VSGSREYPIFIHPNLSYLPKSKRLTTQDTTTTTPPRSQEGHGQLRKERMTLVSPRLHALGSRV
jgi:hypothetical protein